MNKQEAIKYLKSLNRNEFSETEIDDLKSLVKSSGKAHGDPKVELD